MQTSIRKFVGPVVCGMIMLLATGCTFDKVQTKERNAAEARYHQVRSAMILQTAESQFRTGDLTEAERSLSEAVEIDKTNPRLYVMLGRIALERGLLDSANSYFKAAIAVNDKYPDGYYYRGIVLQRWQKHDEAYAHYIRAYELQPEQIAYLLAAAEMLINTGEQDKALAMLREKESYFEGNAGIRVALAQIYMLKKQPEKAAPYYRQASLLQPDDEQIREEYAHALLAAKDYDDAITVLGELLQHPNRISRSDLKHMLGSAYVASGRLSQARDHYHKMTRENAADLDAWINLGHVSYKLHNLSGAVDAANRVMTLAPRRHEGYLLAGMVWHQRRETDRALRYFDRAAELAPGDTMPLILRGLTLEQAGRKTAAAESYREALNRQPDDARAKRLLTRVAGAD